MDFFPENRPLDFIAVGRAGLDLYAAEHRTDFRDVVSFRKHVGGSPANITAQLAALGRRTGLITKVSDDMVGRFVISFFEGIGTDTSRIRIDAEGGCTSLAITEMKPEQCGVVIYRGAASDQRLRPEEIDEEYVARAAGLIVSGFTLAASPGREAALKAIDCALRRGTRVIFDLDYRPYSWASRQDAALYMGLAAEKADMLIGNDDEFTLLNPAARPGSSGGGIRQVVEPWLDRGCRLVICTRGGKAGPAAFDRQGGVYEGRLFPTRPLKPFGAGDAFLGTVLHFLMRSWDIPAAVDRGAAAASMVIAREGCSDASPTEAEIERYIRNCRGGEQDAAAYPAL